MHNLLMLAVVVFMVETVAAEEFSWTIRTHGGDEYVGYALDRVNGDTLFVARQTGQTEIVLLDSIASLKRERRGAVLPATIIGAAAGGVAGYALKPVARDQEQANVYSAAFGVVIGGVTGYLVGSLLQPDEVVELRGASDEERARRVRKLLVGD